MSKIVLNDNREINVKWCSVSPLDNELKFETLDSDFFGYASMLTAQNTKNIKYFRDSDADMTTSYEGYTLCSITEVNGHDVVSLKKDVT